MGTQPAARIRWQDRRAATSRAAAGSRRWSNQCAVLELLGQEPGHRRVAAAGRPSRLPHRPDRLDRGPGQDRRAAAGTCRLGGAAPPAVAMAAEHLGDRSGLAVADHQGPAVHVLDPVDGGDQRVDGVVDVRACRPGRRRSRGSAGVPRRARSTMRADQLGVAGSPDQVRTDREHPQRRPVGGQGDLLGHGLAAGVVAPGVRPDRPVPRRHRPAAEPAWATEGDDTCTRRGTPRSRQACDHRAVPVTLVRRNSGQGHRRSRPWRRGGPRRPAPRRRAARLRGRRCRPGPPAGRARRDGVAGP